MKNVQVIELFVNREKGTFKGGSIALKDNCLFSFMTCIAQSLDNGMYLLNSVKYTPTTSKHESMVRKRLDPSKIIEVSNVPSGATNLTDYYNVKNS